MTDNVESAIIPILQRIQGDIAEIKASLRSVKDDISGMRSEMAAMHTHSAAIHTVQAHQRSELAMLDARMRRLEEKMGIEDLPPPTH
jgi:predicted  nucleic acid-binding Zn-ribbon protein